MEQIPIPTGEFAYGASLSALGPVMLPNARLLSELNAPKGKPRMQTLFQFPEIVVPCSSASRRGAGLETFMEQMPIATGEVACGASLSALGPVKLPNGRLLNALNVPKGKPRMRPLIQCPDIVPCAAVPRYAGLGTSGLIE